MFRLVTTLKIGVEPKHPLDIYKAFRAKKYKIGSEPAMMVEKAAAIQNEERVLRLVGPSVEELECRCDSDMAPRSEILEKGLQRGLLLCPPEVSWQFCLHCKHLLAVNDELVVAMEPIVVPGSGPLLFAVLRVAGTVILGFEPGMPTVGFRRKTRFLFVEPEK